MKLYTGLDVSLRSVAICVVDEVARFGMRRRLRPMSIASLRACSRGVRS
jgi:hypothetical protein